MARKKIVLTKEEIQDAVHKTVSNGQAAKLLGVSYQTLIRRCDEFKIEIQKNPGGKGLTASERYGEEKAIILSAQIAARPRFCSNHTRMKLRDHALKRIDEGKMPSKGLKGRYNGIWFDSSWELAYYLWMKEIHKTHVTRNTKIFFDYTDDNGVLRRTKPDFILPSGELIEIKGYPNIHTNAKIRALSDRVSFIFGKDLKECLSYVREKYGHNFTKRLYADVGELVDPAE